MSGILRWPAICGNGDGGIFWDPQVTLNTSSPDLTLCFQSTVISWVPLALLWITLPFYLPFLLVKPTINTWRNKSKLNITKLFLSVLLLIVSLIDLSHGISKGSNTDLALIYYISPAIMALSMILTLYLIHLEYQKGVYTSGVFFIVWLLMVLLDIVPFRSNILQLNKGKVDDKLLFVTFYIKYGLVLGQFILALFVDAAVNNVLEIDERTPLLQDNAETLNSGTVTEKCNKPPCPEETSSFFSTLLHWWCTRLLVKGYRKPLTFDDMYDIMDDDRGKSVIKKFNSEWEKQTGGHTSRRSVSDGRQPSFMWTLIRAAWGPFWISFLARLAMCFTEYLGPVLLSVMLEVLSDKNDYMWKGIFMAFIMLLGNTINSLVVNYFFKFGYLFSMRVRTAVTLAVYRKALKLSSTARKTTTVGQIVNLMSVDAQKLHDTFIEMHEVWAGPLQIIIGMSILWNIMGPSSLAGLGVLLILAPINGFYLIRKFTKLQEIQMKQKDERIKMVNEILNGIKVLKMYAWEKYFAQFVGDIREKELHTIKIQAYINGEKAVLIEIRRQLSRLSEPDTESDISKSDVERTLSSPGIRSRNTSTSRANSISPVMSKANDTATQIKPTAIKDKLIEEETAAVGQINSSVLKAYIRAGGIPYMFSLVIMVMLYAASMALTSSWLSAWSDDDPLLNGTERKEQTVYRLGVYGGFGFLQMVSVAGFSLSLYLGCLNASRIMHSRLLNAILRSPMAFFDTTPLGRIVNRFSTDMDKLDTNIPQFTRWFLVHLSTMVTTIIIISISTPIFLVVVFPLGLMYYIIQKLYITAVRQMKRIDSIRKSPIYTNFDETLVGVTCIRAFKQQDRFIAKNDLLMDESNMAWYPIVIAQRWIGVFLDLIGGLVVFFSAIFAILERDNISAGTAGLSISFAMQATISIHMMVRGATELETHVVSVERVKEYSEVPSEASWEEGQIKPSEEWPNKGVVEFKDYQTRYRSGLDLVLKGLNCTINSGEKIGIVGRTGAGKSSMTLSLFRIIEATGGAIYIDGLNISQLALHDLRSRLTIIPQDPVLFSGTIRHNLDPVGHYQDEAIWLALHQAHLKTFISGLNEGLGYQCGEGGETLSVGQRQLVCLARALLHKSQILILDEATAAVDLETDDLIQTTIRTAFQECTVMTVAHRINTIMDYDRVMVLDQGLIKEFDSPSSLLNKDSAFKAMAEDARLL